MAEPRKGIDELLERLEQMEESLSDEHGAERDYLQGEYNKELQDYALDLGLELLRSRQKA
jgi:hypothetical protein